MTRPADHYCGDCRYALNRRRINGVDVFEHTISTPAELVHHKPRPVPLAEFINPNMVCDFCGTPGPSLAYTFVDTTAVFVNDETGDRFMENMGADWSVCTGCAGQVDQRNVNGLIARVVRKYPAAARPSVSDHLRLLYEPLLTHPFTKRAMG